MKSERYSIIYSSKTGNTKKLAETIYNTLSKNECDYYGEVNKINGELSDMIYIGFWTEKGLSVVPILQNICKWSGLYYDNKDKYELPQCKRCDYKR